MDVNINKIEQSASRKHIIDNIVKYIFFFIALICASSIIFIAVFILIKGLTPFFKTYTSSSGEKIKESFSVFFFETTWSLGDQFGVCYLIINTLFATFCSLIISIPVSILTALLIVQIAPKYISIILQAGIELLSSIPSVIYGLFGAGYITKIVLAISNAFNYSSFGGASLLSGVIVLAIMSIPTMTLMSIGAIKGVDKNLIQASLALGASKTQTNFKIVIKAASSGIFAGIILGVGRALGEASAIQMVIGNATSGISFDLLAPSSTLTTNMLMGMGEAVINSLGYDIRFTAGILLILIIFIIDVILNSIKNSIYYKQTGKGKIGLFNKLIIKIKNNFTKPKIESLKQGE